MSFAVWNLPKSGSHYLTQTLNVALGGNSILAFEFDIRLNGTTSVKSRLATECLTQGRNCAGAQQMAT